MATSPDTLFAPVHNFHPKPSRLPSTSLSALKLAHATLIGTLLREQAEEIVGCWAHPSEIVDRADHAEKVLKAAIDYVDVIMRDTADYAFMHRDVVVAGLRDATADLAAHVRFRAELMAEERAEA